MIVTISKGLQITIPAQFRSALGFEVGSRAEITKDGNKLVIKPIADDIEVLFRQAKTIRPRRGFSARQMDDEVENELHRC